LSGDAFRFKGDGRNIERSGRGPARLMAHAALARCPIIPLTGAFICSSSFVSRKSFSTCARVCRGAGRSGLSASSHTSTAARRHYSWPRWGLQLHKRLIQHDNSAVRGQSCLAIRLGTPERRKSKLSVPSMASKESSGSPRPGTAATAWSTGRRRSLRPFR